MSDDFRPADLVAAVLRQSCNTLCQALFQMALANDVNVVILVGSFVDHPVVRRALMGEWLLKVASSREKTKVNISRRHH